MRSDGSQAKQPLGSGFEAEMPWSNRNRVAKSDGNGEFGTSYFQTWLIDCPSNCSVFANHELPGHRHDWYPTSDRLGYGFANQITEANPDLTGQQTLASGPEVGHAPPRYSPAGDKIVYGYEAGEVYSINADGSGKTNLTNNAANDKNPIWSPDGQKIAFQSNRDGDFDIYVMNRDGSGVVQVTNGPGEEPLFDWQPILKGYPRPKAATPLYLPLVPAYQPCTAGSATKTHAPPLAYGSCTAAQTSNQLTVGSFDANAKAANSTGYIRMVRLGDLTTPADDSDVRLVQ